MIDKIPENRENIFCQYRTALSEAKQKSESVTIIDYKIFY